MTVMTGGQALVEALRAHDVNTVFGVLGSTLLPVYDALYESPIKLFTPRSEDGAGHMADAYARVSGKPGVVMSTAGPGAAGVAAAMGEAYAESWPLLHIATQIPTPYLDKEKGVYHDGPNQRLIFRSVSSWDHRVTSLNEIPEAITEAFRRMQTGRPRPVFLEIPADILREKGDVSITGPAPCPAPNVDEAAVKAAADILMRAEAPLLCAGGGCVKAKAGEELRALAELLQAPILCTTGAKGIVADDHPLMVGNLVTVSEIVERDVLGRSDAMLAIGTRFTQRATGWWRLKMPKPLIHADIDASEFGRNYPPDLSVEADAKVFLMRLLEVLQGRGFKAARTVEKETKATKNRALDVMRQQHPEEFRMLDDVRAAVPRDGIVAVQSMLGHWCRFALDRYQPSSFLFANSYGSMGFAFHAAIGAKIAAPDRSVVAFCGDGGFMMGCGEMATLAQYDLGIPVVIVNNGGFAILRERQKKNFSRTIGTDLFNPDFVTFARSFGIDGCRINDLDAFGPALSKAVNDGKPYMIEVPVEFKDYRGGQIQ